MKITLRRTVVALTTACALLLLAAAPASASTHTSTVVPPTTTPSSNSVILTKTGSATQTLHLDPDPTGLCPPLALTFTAAHTHPTGSITATLASTGRFFFPNGATGPTDHYIAVITGSSTVAPGQAGTYNNGSTSTTATINSLSLRLTIKLYTGGSTSCTPGATALCTWTTTIHVTGTYTGNIASGVAASDRSDLTFASTTNLALGGVCAAPFSTYTGSVVTGGIHLHVT